MKILALIHKYPEVHCAGAEVMLHAMLKDLVGRGHECIATYPGAQAAELDGVSIVPTPRRDHEVVQAARASDVLITHLDVTPRAMRVARDADRPLVHLVHNDAQLGHHKVGADRAALVVWNSEWIAESYRSWPGESMIVRPPVAFEEYRRDIPAKTISGDVTLINLTQAKGAPLAWDLAGQAPDRAFLGVRGAYGIQVEPKRRLRNVEVLAHLPAARMRDEVYARTRVLLVPSSYESWGRVAIEACCAGIPVIAHPTPGLLESLGSAGIFADRGRSRDWLAHLDRLDDPVEYRAAGEVAIARARELDVVARADLDAFALRLEAVVDAYARPMAILGSSSLASKCPVCGARNCACGPTGGEDGIRVVRPARRGLPLQTYETERGTLRLNEDHARRLGLLPAVEPEPVVDVPAPSGDVPPVDGRVGEMLAWAGDTDPDRIRAAIEAERAARDRPSLIGALEKLLEEL